MQSVVLGHTTFHILAHLGHRMIILGHLWRGGANGLATNRQGLEQKKRISPSSKTVQFPTLL